MELEAEERYAGLNRFKFWRWEGVGRLLWEELSPVGHGQRGIFGSEGFVGRATYRRVQQRWARKIKIGKL